MKEQNRAGSIYLAGIAIWKIWLAEAKAESKTSLTASNTSLS